MTDQGQASAKREAAARARRLARELDSAEDRALALQFAAELEAQAEELDQKAVRTSPQVPPGSAQQSDEEKTSRPADTSP